MWPRIAAMLHEFIANIRVADALDITVIAVCLYFALTWVRRRGTRPVATGITLVALLYVVAQRLDMYLTSLVFQAGLTAILVALVLIFQEDIRRQFERFVAWGGFAGWKHLKGAQSRSAFDKTIDSLVEAAATMGGQRIGALIVIQGREDPSRHIGGGIVLDGQVSASLVRTIFQPNSPGHDGAVMIAGDRIERFAAHLPLSDDHEALGQRGTRHAAALGLAERCDVLAIVVSEETGVTSVAEHGKLAALESPTELSERLSQHYAAAFPEPTKAATGGWLMRNLGLKITALVLACLLWLLFAYQPETLQRTMAVPIEYRNLPKGWALEEGAPAQVKVTLAGPERVFDLLNPSSLVISLDLSNMKDQAQTITLAEPQVKNKPTKLRAVQFDPDEVTLRAKKAGVGP